MGRATVFHTRFAVKSLTSRARRRQIYRMPEEADAREGYGKQRRAEQIAARLGNDRIGAAHSSAVDVYRKQWYGGRVGIDATAPHCTNEPLARVQQEGYLKTRQFTMKSIVCAPEEWRPSDRRRPVERRRRTAPAEIDKEIV